MGGRIADGQVFPGHGGFRKQQEAGEKVKAIERLQGGPMDREEKYRKFPCLQPGWPDKLQEDKREFEYELEARERKQQAHDKQRATSPSLTQAKLADQALALAKLNDDAAKDSAEAEEDADKDGGYEGDQAFVFENLFGDEDVEHSDEEAEGVAGAQAVLSPSLMASGAPHEEGVEEELAGAIPESEMVDRRYNPEPDAAPVANRLREEGGYWMQAFAAGGFGQKGKAEDPECAYEDWADETNVAKRRRWQVEGLAFHEDEYDDRDLDGEEQADY